VAILKIGERVTLTALLIFSHLLNITESWGGGEEASGRGSALVWPDNGIVLMAIFWRRPFRISRYALADGNAMF
jgi:hypothetical protein